MSVMSVLIFDLTDLAFVPAKSPNREGRCSQIALFTQPYSRFSMNVSLLSNFATFNSYFIFNLRQF